MEGRELEHCFVSIITAFAWWESVDIVRTNNLCFNIDGIIPFHRVKVNAVLPLFCLVIEGYAVKLGT